MSVTSPTAPLSNGFPLRICKATRLQARCGGRIAELGVLLTKAIQASSAGMLLELRFLERGGETRGMKYQSSHATRAAINVSSSVLSLSLVLAVSLFSAEPSRSS